MKRTEQYRSTFFEVMKTFGKRGYGYHKMMSCVEEAIGRRELIVNLDDEEMEKLWRYLKDQ